MKRVLCVDAMPHIAGGASLLKNGETYWVDLASIWTDRDGDEYATIHSFPALNEEYVVGQFKTSRFKDAMKQ